jgi:hypothetical protein
VGMAALCAVSRATPPAGARHGWHHEARFPR